MAPLDFLRRGRITKGASLAMQSSTAGGELAVEAAAAQVAAGPVGPFSPGLPLRPTSQDTGDQPRAFDFRTGYNTIARPDRDRRVSFQVLRDLIDHYDVARMAIGHRIDDVRSLDWRIVPEDSITTDVSGAVELAKRILKRPDGRHKFGTWLAMYLEDVLRYDAGALYKRRDRAGRVIGLDVVDGTTLAPLLDYYGRTPTGDAPAFVQYVQGTPWQWIKSADLVYEPFRPQPNSPYGFAPLEAVLLNANTDVRFQVHFLNYFTEGTIPGGFAQLPADISSPEQVKQWQEYYDALLYGDEAAKHQLRWVPNGTTFDWPRNESFDEAFPLFLMRKTAAAYHVTPNDLGFTEDVNRASSETQVDVQFRVGTKPLLTHLQGILDDYLQADLGLPVSFRFDTGQEKEDRVATAQAHKIYVDMGAESLDEVRAAELGLPTDESRPTPRFIMSERLGPIPLASLLAIAGPTDPKTAAPSEAAPVSEVPFDGTPGLLAIKPPGGPAYKRAPINPDDPQRPQLEHPVPGTETIAPPAPAQKSLTPGVTGATGLVGVDLGGGTVNPRPTLPGDDDDDDDDQVGGDVVKALEGAGELAGGPTVAGLAVKADDTGRVLLLQRCNDPADPAAGTWEFPGGHLEGDEDTFAGAVREWQEETGCRLPAGVAGGTWDGPNGVYRGHVWLIPTEDSLTINPQTGRVLNPDDPDGDAVEVCAWWDVDQLAGMPGLRPELAAALPVDLLEAAHLPDGDAIRKELRRWRSNARTRVAKGLTPRRFTSEVLPAQLLEGTAYLLAGSSTRQQVDDAFTGVIRPKGDPVAPVRKSWRDGPDTHPGHAFDLRLTDYYAPQVARALGALWTDAQLTAAIEAAARQLVGVVVKAADPVTDRVLAAVREALGRGDTADLESVMRQAFADAWQAGAHVAAGQLPDNPAGAAGVVTGAGGISGATWSQWQPGHPDAAGLVADGGLRDLLDEAGVRIKELSGTTVDQLGAKIADGLKAGHPVDKIGRSLRSLLGGNASRAEMIAHTETARAMTASSLSVYDANGIGQWTLVTSSGACPVCLDVQAGGPYGVNDTGAAPPLHPRCRCAASPVVGSVAAGDGLAGGGGDLEGALSELGGLFEDAGEAAAETAVGGDLEGDLEGGDEAEGDDQVDDDVDEAEAGDEAEAEGDDEEEGDDETGPAADGGDLTALTDDDLAAALETADDDTVDRILAELDRRDAADAAPAPEPEPAKSKAPTKAELKAARDAELEAAWDAAIAAGEDPEDSYARIYGVDTERMKRDEAIASLRSAGYKGRGFDELVRSAFREFAERARWDAEAETNGYLVNNAGVAKGIDPMTLFVGPESRARKYASDELRAYWQQNPRLTVDDFRASLLGGAMRSASTGYWA